MKHARPDYERIQDPAGLIPADEPVMIFRAQDMFAVAALCAYRSKLAVNLVDPHLIAAIDEQIKRFDAWPKKKVPDLPPPPAVHRDIRA